MIESTDQWMKRIGSKAAMEEGQRLRREGSINQPIKGPKGLAKLAALIRPYRKSEPAPPQSEQPLLTVNPVVVIAPAGKNKKRRKSEQGFKQPSRKWDEQRGRSGN